MSLDEGEQEDIISTNDRTDNSVSSEDAEKGDDEDQFLDDDENNALVMRKKRRQKYSREYYRRTHPFTPIFKNDIRRQIGRMWVNMINWSDPFRTKKFFQHFSASDCIHVNIFETPPHIRNYFPTIKPIAGARQAVLHASYNAVCVPDCTCRIVECTMIQSKDHRGTKISLKVHFTGTKVFELGSPNTSTLAMIQNSLDALSLRTPAEQAEAGNDVLFDELPHIDLNTLRSMRHLLVNPLAMEADGVFVLKLNEQHQMIAHEFYWQDVKVRPLSVVHEPAVVEELSDPISSIPTKPSSTSIPARTYAMI